MPELPTSGIDPRLPVVWGVLNVTPDSFSDGGLFESVAAATAQGRLLAKQGADIIDIGGESTRPGAARVPVDVECDRVLPVIEELVSAGATVSIDTMRAEVARMAVERGASIVNDVSGGRADPSMHATVAELGVPYVLMHWRSHATSMDQFAHYDDVVVEVCDELQEQIALATTAGIARERIIVDPGIGFAKDLDHNWTLLRSMDRIRDLGLPILVGASRKRFLGALLSDAEQNPRDSHGRDVATAALSALLVDAGVWGLRVHDVQGTVDALKVAYMLGVAHG